MRPRADGTAEVPRPNSTVAYAECDSRGGRAKDGNWDLVGNDGQAARSFQPQQPAANAANTGVKDERND